MASYTFDVSAILPGGLKGRVLSQEIAEGAPDAWGLHIERYNRRLCQVVTDGTLILGTDRPLHAIEYQTLMEMLAEHDPTASSHDRPGSARRQLGDARHNAGTLTYCRTVPRADGSGNGAMVYSSGDAWRRVSDDLEI